MTLTIRKFGNVRPVIGERVWLDPASTLIGDVHLGADCSIWPGVVLRGDVNRIRVGQRTNIQDGCIAHVTHDGPLSPGGLPLIIGDDVTVGHAAVLHACTIGNRCLIGMSALLLDGVVVEDQVMVAAGSLVSPGKRLESGWLYRGSPARPARRLDEGEIEMLRYSAEHYVRLKDRYLQDHRQDE
ncbi:MAG: gamma carbonic anhydrase family protein [Xanthomonadaceae bacterium]|nr:gamma carbonic anhydrase family protein [Xanthomonadaceae bacterium]